MRTGSSSPGRSKETQTTRAFGSPCSCLLVGSGTRVEKLERGMFYFLNWDVYGNAVDDGGEKLWDGICDHIPTFLVINKNKIFVIPNIRLSCFVDTAIFCGRGPLVSEASGWRATCIFEPQPPSIPSRDLTPVTHFMGHKSKFDPRAQKCLD